MFYPLRQQSLAERDLRVRHYDVSGGSWPAKA